MSAWRVSKTHIDALVQAMIVEGIVQPKDATEVGKRLWQDNYDSVDYRYDEHVKLPEYVFEGIEAPLRDEVLFRNIKCYWFQTCEHPENKCYDESEGTELRKLYDAIAARHGTSYYDYDEANAWVHEIESVKGRIVWGIDTWDDVVDKTNTAHTNKGK